MGGYCIAFAIISAIHSSNGEGIILSKVGFFTKFAKFFAACIFISSVIFLTLFCKAHLKIHGKTRTLLS
jgi:hypothetical protein